MAGPFAFGEAEVLTFTQRGGESLKDAWYRINDSQKRATKKQSTTILLRNFYVGINSWNRFLLDTAMNGNFIEAPVWEGLNVIENLVGNLPIASIKEDITLAHIYNTIIDHPHYLFYLDMQPIHISNDLHQPYLTIACSHL